MSEEHAKINRLELLQLALVGAQHRYTQAGHQIIDIQREIDAINHPISKRPITNVSEIAHKPAKKARKSLSAAARKKISVAQKKRWADARKVA